MTGFRPMNQLMGPATREQVLHEHADSGNGFAVAPTVKVAKIPKVTRSPKVRQALPISKVAYLDRKVRLVPDLNEVWSYINTFILYGRHMGFRGDFEKRFAKREPKAVELFESMEEVKHEAAEFLKPTAVWQFFEVEGDGEAMHLFALGGGEPYRPFSLRGSVWGDYLCLSDYILPPQNGECDHIALFVVTAGEGVRERSEKMKNDGYYFK
jgi:5-methyltetrahydrofolate--homocysteine methyltransferase